MRFEGNKEYSTIQKGSQLKITMEITNEVYKNAKDMGKSPEELEKLAWTTENLQFLTALLDVYDDKSVSISQWAFPKEICNPLLGCQNLRQKCGFSRGKE